MVGWYVVTHATHTWVKKDRVDCTWYGQACASVMDANKQMMASEQHTRKMSVNGGVRLLAKRYIWVCLGVTFLGRVRK